ncbi:ABC-type uncharacterized transport system, permease component, partial [Mycoplasmopsis edwardii]
MPLLFLLPGVILLVMFTIVPLVLNLKESLFNSDGELTFDNYIATFTDPRFAVGVRNSFIYGLAVLPFVMAISLTISSVIAKLHRKW